MQEWPAGSLEEVVQNAIKTWEMELSHKARLSDFKSVSPGRFTLSVNGGRARSGEETLAVGSYNALLDSPLLASAGAYDAAAETFASSHDLFRAAFPRGFAWEVLGVYSGPPVIAFKFRHWGHMEGPYKGHAATGEKVEFRGVAVLKVDEQLRAEDVEVYYDPGELLGGLLKGPKVASSEEERGEVVLAERLSEAATVSASGADPPPRACPFLSSGKPQ
ncbi:hypothetical protein SEVIR_5G309400v4 [Setaria viridis]|uniref:Pathogen-related protein n=2 Tax=Setaria TaxID=4554 RepID=K3XLU4_SETIT|nr:hypothetical protein SETIT_5G306700v2 [Setaria italica]TKW16598.1 hypothetical protein SEVIR_5G309400v2 [Setaria viridis]